MGPDNRDDDSAEHGVTFSISGTTTGQLRAALDTGAGNGSLVFEVNMPLWRFGRGKSRSMSFQEAEKLRSARVNAARQQAASTKRRRNT
jgi:hypothetical protein